MADAKIDMVATVTITVDEYCDLRAKADANMFLIREFGIIDGRFREVEQRVYDLENRIEEMGRRT